MLSTVGKVDVGIVCPKGTALGRTIRAVVQVLCVALWPSLVSVLVDEICNI